MEMSYFNISFCYNKCIKYNGEIKMSYFDKIKQEKISIKTSQLLVS